MTTQTQARRSEISDLLPEERAYVRSHFIDRYTVEAVALGADREAAATDAEQWFDEQHPEVQP